MSAKSDLDEFRKYIFLSIGGPHDAENISDGTNDDHLMDLVDRTQLQFAKKMVAASVTPPNYIGDDTLKRADRVTRNLCHQFYRVVYSDFVRFYYYTFDFWFVFFVRCRCRHLAHNIRLQREAFMFISTEHRVEQVI